MKALLKKQGKGTAPEPVGNVMNRTIPGPGARFRSRIYTPKGSGPFPVVVYYHGGGWVIANLDTYDASPRALVNLANAVVGVCRTTARDRSTSSPPRIRTRSRHTAGSSRTPSP